MNFYCSVCLDTLILYQRLSIEVYYKNQILIVLYCLHYVEVRDNKEIKNLNIILRNIIEI